MIASFDDVNLGRPAESFQLRVQQVKAGEGVSCPLDEQGRTSNLLPVRRSKLLVAVGRVQGIAKKDESAHILS